MKYPKYILEKSKKTGIHPNALFAADGQEKAKRPIKYYLGRFSDWWSSFDTNQKIRIILGISAIISSICIALMNEKMDEITKKYKIKT